MDGQDVSIVILDAPRRRGRPRMESPKVLLAAKVPPAYYQRILALASKHDVSMSRVVCKLLADALRRPS